MALCKFVSGLLSKGWQGHNLHCVRPLITRHSFKRANSSVLRCIVISEYILSCVNDWDSFLISLSTLDREEISVYEIYNFVLILMISSLLLVP